MASLAAKGFGFVLLLVGLRVLGTVRFGEYSTVLAVVGLFGVATDLGLSTLAVRDSARDLARLPGYVGSVLALRLLLTAGSIAACVVLALVPGLLHAGASVRAGIVLWALALVPMTLVGVCAVVFQATERLATLSALTTATAALSALAGCTMLLLGGGVVALVAAALASNIVVDGIALLLARRIVPMRPRVELRSWPGLLRTAVPFAMLSLLNVLYSRADAVLVYSMAGPAAAGLYGVSYRLVDTLLVVVIAPFNAAALPAFNRIAVRSQADLQSLVLSGLRITLAVGVPVAIGTTIYAPLLLHLVGGRPEYGAAVPALQWLAWSFPCFTVLAILYNALYAVGRAVDLGRIFALTLVFNVVLNLVLIPRYSFTASAALTTASELLNVVLAGLAVRRYVGDPLGAWAVVPACAGAGAVMAVVCTVAGSLGPLLGPVVGLPAGCLAYLAVLRLTGAFGARERAVLARVPLVGRWAQWL